MSDMPTTLRLGKFRISRDAILFRPEECRLVLRDVIVTKAENSITWDAICYEGIHPSFDELTVASGAVFDVPHYDALLRMNEDKTVEFMGWQKL